MKIFECKCGSTEVFIEQQGNNCGLYCADCGKWITWLNKDSKRLAERQINGVEQKIRSKAIDDFTEKLNIKCDGMIKDKWNSNVSPISWAEAYADFKDDIDEIAEQLKAGDTDASNGA